MTTELSLFSGAGGGLLATKWLLGSTIVGYVERDEYCQKVLRARIRDGLLDDAPIFSDVRTFNGRPYRGRVDCITAGFPCQPFSVAGKRKGADDERNGWPDTIRIIREVQPQFCFLENVPGLLSEYFSVVLGDLAEAGFDAQWCVLGASDVGANHRRKRLWILADSHKVRSHDTSPKRELEGKRSCQSCWWAIEPNMGRVAHGVARRVDRLKALGNGQVPLVAKTAFEKMVSECQL